MYDGRIFSLWNVLFIPPLISMVCRCIPVRMKVRARQDDLALSRSEWKKDIIISGKLYTDNNRNNKKNRIWTKCTQQDFLQVNWARFPSFTGPDPFPITASA